MHKGLHSRMFVPLNMSLLLTTLVKVIFIQPDLGTEILFVILIQFVMLTLLRFCVPKLCRTEGLKD